MKTEFITKALLPTEFGQFYVHVLTYNNQEHLVLTMGDFNPEDEVLTRIHSECLTGDGLFSVRCDCGPQLKYAMKKISQKKQGMIIYLRQEGRGIGLLEKIKAYQLQDEGMDTFDANVKLGHAPDNRNYDMLAGIFSYFKISKINLMTNNPDKISAIKKAGVTCTSRIDINVGQSTYNKEYINTKKNKFNHL